MEMLYVIPQCPIQAFRRGTSTLFEVPLKRTELPHVIIVDPRSSFVEHARDCTCDFIVAPSSDPATFVAIALHGEKSMLL